MVDDVRCADRDDTGDSNDGVWQSNQPKLTPALSDEVGFLCSSGTGPGECSAPNLPMAMKYYKLSANGGWCDGQAHLGAFYALGIGVPQDDIEAYFWADIAASSGTCMHPNKATAFRDEEASHLTPEVLLSTQERARKWLEAHPSD
jgi:hypothetical protein